MTTAQRAPSTPVFSGVVVVSTVPSARIASVVILSPVVCDISITGEITAGPRPAEMTGLEEPRAFVAVTCTR